jgi:hypothetical protein
VCITTLLERRWQRWVNTSRPACLAATAEVPPIPAVTTRGSQLTLCAITGREQMQQAQLLDRLVYVGEQLGRHLKAERPGRLKVDDELEFR